MRHASSARPDRSDRPDRTPQPQPAPRAARAGRRPRSARPGTAAGWPRAGVAAAAALLLAGAASPGWAASCSFSSGVYSGSGCPVSLASGDVLNIVGGGYKYLDTTLANQSGALVAASDNLYFNDGSVLNNAGLFRMDADLGLYPNGSTGQFVNSGTLQKAGGAGDSHVGLYNFVSNGGSVNVGSGRLLFDYGVTLNSGSSFSGAGTTLLNGGAVVSGALSATGSLVFASGSFTGQTLQPATLQAGSSLNWTGGTLAGSWVVASGATLGVNPGGYKYLDGSLGNQGVVIASDNLYFNNASTLTNQGTYQLAGDVGLYSNGGSNSFTNHGTLAKVGGAGDSHVNLSGFTNGATGVLNVQTGRLIFDTGVTFNSGSSTSGAGQVLVSNGATVNGTINTAGNLYLTGGTVTGVNAVANGDVYWTNGTLGGSWTTTSGSALRVVGGGYKYVGGNMANAGTVVASDNLYFNDGSSVDNSGRYELAGDVGLYSNGGSNAFTNTGTLVKTGGSGDSHVNLSSFTNGATGVITVQSGRLVFDSAPSFVSGSSINGTGQVLVTNGATISGTLNTAGNLVLTGGTVTANNALATGDVVWSGGTLGGSWTTANGSALRLVGGGYKYVGGNLTNAGTVVASDNLYLNPGASFTNNGRYELAGDVGLYSGGGSNAFTNAGTLVKTGGAGDAHVNLSDFSNAGSGVIQVQSGRLLFDTPASFASGSTFSGTGQVLVTSGAVFTGQLNTAGNLYLTGGTVTGVNAVANGDVYWTNGTVGGSWTTTSGSALRVVGGGYKYIGGNMANAGTVVASDNLYFNDGSSFSNSGRYEFAGDVGWYGNGGSATLTNTGTLAKVGGAGDSHIGLPGFTNSGRIDVQSGRIVFDSAVTLAAGTQLSGPGVALVTAGGTVAGAVSTAGNLYLAGGTTTGANAVVSGGARWINGTLAGNWKTAAGSTLYLDGGGYKYTQALTLDGRTVATDHLYINSGDSFNQKGSYQLAGDVGLYNGGIVNNSGSIAKTGGAGVSDLSNVALVNTGVLDAQVGTIVLANGYANDGVLTGNGHFALAGGTLLQRGTIKPGDGIGTLTLNAPLVQAASAVLDIELDTLASHDLLVLSGGATLDGTLLVECAGLCSFANGTRIQVIDGNAALNGVFSGLQSAGFLGGSWTVDYSQASLGDLFIVANGDITAAVPEPQTWALWAAGLLALGTRAARRRKPDFTNRA